MDSLPEEERARWEDADFSGTKALDMPNALERTPLHLACERGNEDCVRFRIETNPHLQLARPNCFLLNLATVGLRVGDVGKHFAKSAGEKAPEVRWLLEKLADPNAETLSGMMPLHFCCREKHAGCVKALLGPDR